MVPLYKNSDIFIDHRKLLLCDDKSAKVYASRLMMCVFKINPNWKSIVKEGMSQKLSNLDRHFEQMIFKHADPDVSLIKCALNFVWFVLQTL